MSFRIEEHLDELRDPRCFGGRGAVEVLQTHISVVCLAGDRAFKFKKAVELPFLDFSSVARREGACRDELRLNRRLAPDVYLAVEPLVRREDGGLRVGGADSEAIDWCVVMERLPQERMLDELLEAGRVEPDDIRRLARIVAAFHRDVAGAADARVREAGSPERLVEQVRANFEQIGALEESCLDPALFDAVRGMVEDRLSALQQRLEARARAGRIVEGHGDLHARNICIAERPVIYDCIEFRLDFRAGDVATDVAFLVMDLRYRGRRDLADLFVEEYAKASGDDEIGAVLPELVRYRAMVRAKVDAIAHRDENRSPSKRESSCSAARRHLRLCAWTLIEERQPTVVVGSGLPASGKSTVLRALSEEAGWPRFATDRVRKELAGRTPRERLGAEFYTEEFSDRTYAEVLRRGVRARGSAVADGNFPNHRRRSAAIETAEAAGKRAAVVEIRVDESVARERLRQRAAEEDADGAVSDADEEVFDRLRGRFQPPADAIVLDGTAPVEDSLDRLALRLLG